MKASTFTAPCPTCRNDAEWVKHQDRIFPDIRCSVCPPPATVEQAKQDKLQDTHWRVTFDDDDGYPTVQPYRPGLVEIGVTTVVVAVLGAAGVIRRWLR